MKYTIFNTAVGEIALAGDENGLAQCSFLTSETNRKFKVNAEWENDSQFFKDVIQQLKEYFAGARQNFDIKVNPSGTIFQKSVWKALTKIPYGKTSTYNDIAIAVGTPKACRAVGMANNKNPIAIIIPCHRVIGTSGKLVGYAGGIDIKTRLLSIENPDFKIKQQGIKNAPQTSKEI